MCRDWSTRESCAAAQGQARGAGGAVSGEPTACFNDHTCILEGFHRACGARGAPDAGKPPQQDVMVICEWGGWEGGPTGRNVGGEPRGSAAEERPGDAAPVFPGCLLQAAPRRCPACRTCSRPDAAPARCTCWLPTCGCTCWLPHLPGAPAGFPPAGAPAGFCTCQVHLLAWLPHQLGAAAGFPPARCTCWLPHLPGAPAGFPPARCTC